MGRFSNLMELFALNQTIHDILQVQFAKTTVWANKVDLFTVEFFQNLSIGLNSLMYNAT